MRVRIRQPRSDCLVVERGRNWLALGLGSALATAIVGTLTWLDLSSGGGLLLFSLLGTLVVALGVGVYRSSRTQRWTLVRTPGRLLVDGEPLELARVELRVTQLPITRSPTGYALSLWLMTAAGPVDIPLGRYKTLVEASANSGTVEDFVQRSNIKQPGHTGA